MATREGKNRRSRMTPVDRIRLILHVDSEARRIVREVEDGDEYAFPDVVFSGEFHITIDPDDSGSGPLAQEMFVRSLAHGIQALLSQIDADRVTEAHYGKNAD